MEYVASMPDLEVLDLGGSCVTNAGLQRLTKCRLSEIDLSGTAVTDAGMAALAEISSLEFVRLPAQIVGGEGIARLQSLPRLKAMTFSSNDNKPDWRRTGNGRERVAPDWTLNDVKQYELLLQGVIARYDTDADGALANEEIARYWDDTRELRLQILMFDLQFPYDLDPAAFDDDPTADGAYSHPVGEYTVDDVLKVFQTGLRLDMEAQAWIHGRQNNRNSASKR